MKYVGCATEDERPGATVARDEPDRIFAGLHLVIVEEHVVVERDSRRRVGARMPDAVPGNELAEESASSRDGTAVPDDDLCERDILSDRAALTWWISLRGG